MTFEFTEWNEMAEAQVRQAISPLRSKASNAFMKDLSLGPYSVGHGGIDETISHFKSWIDLSRAWCKALLDMPGSAYYGYVFSCSVGQGAFWCFPMMQLQWGDEEGRNTSANVIIVKRSPKNYEFYGSSEQVWAEWIAVEKITTDSNWTFYEGPRDKTVTLKSIISGDQPILRAIHLDDDDLPWFFIGPGKPETGDAVKVDLATVFDHDRSINELHDLPLGWEALRDAQGSPWQRRPYVDQAD